MDWLMKGVDQDEQEEETVEPNFDEDAIKNLKQISNSEMQESTTLNSAKESMGANQNAYANNAQNNFGMMPNGMPYNQAQPYAQPYQNPNQFAMQNPMQNNFGMPLNTTQNVFVQQAPNQPFAQTTITIFQIASEEDIQFALMHLGKKSPCAISFNKMSKKKFDSLYQFLRGGVFALGAKIVEWNDSYLLTPRGMEVSKQDRSKR